VSRVEAFVLALWVLAFGCGAGPGRGRAFENPVTPPDWAGGPPRTGGPPQSGCAGTAAEGLRTQLTSGDRRMVAAV